MQTRERRYREPIAIRDWERRDQIAAAAAIVLAILSIWSLALLASQGSKLAELKNAMDQQQTELTNLQNQVSENERKRAQDSALMLRYAGSGSSSGSSQPGAGSTTGNFAANFLYMLTGKDPDEYNAHVMDVALILHADHELNASTFAGRVAAATLTDMHSAVVAAIGALKGPLHGGANQEVIKMLIEIGEPSKVDSYIKKGFEEHKKIMGFGHRVYKTEDPRASHLRVMSEELGKRTGELKWFTMSKQIEELVKKEKGLYCNVDFYSASVYYMLGLPIDLFTPIFAISRVSGWTAHILEQYGNNRLIRPRAEYIGPNKSTYVPIDKRSDLVGSSR